MGQVLLGIMVMSRVCSTFRKVPLTGGLAVTLHFTHTLSNTNPTMTITHDALAVVLFLLAMHYIGDFVLQTHWQASNKSRSNRALTGHVLTYSLTLGIFAVSVHNVLDFAHPVMWVTINALLHFMTDYVTSRASSKRFGRNWHDFFVIIGFDQLLHYTTLLTTYVILQ